MASASSTAVLRYRVAVGLFQRLRKWCVDFFWITLFCLMGFVDDERQKCATSKRNTLYHRRKSTTERMRSRTKEIAEIEMKLLRHLMSPLNEMILSVRKSSKKRPIGMVSRPPSPQLFDICEETEET
ncbi:unnamed protein product, partial [Mesorhabditis belari]|uniref:Uncharacterized protein n=1 Tax=Mesorhabditis belari TaxID=2138241 RepID=A0AAF3F1B7_9BILA